MPSRYEVVSEMAEQTAREIASSGAGRYMAFLQTAANNYKYNFREQLLIFKQKPEATACAEIGPAEKRGTWNSLGRWVNRGTKGIALLVDTSDRYKVRYVFDISDTNSRDGNVVTLWRFQSRYAESVTEALENRFGALEEHRDFVSDVISIADAVVEDNVADYADILRSVKDGSFLEELDDLNTEVWLKSTLKSSVAFMVLTRCGYDARQYFTGEDFSHVYDFNTPETVSVLGDAASDISEMMLREIEVTVRALQREEKKHNRTFANPTRTRDNVRTTTERSAEHGTDLPAGGRLSAAQRSTPGEPEGGQVWDAAARFPARPPQADLHRDAPERQAEQPLGGDRPGGDRDDGAPDHTDGGAGGRDGKPESVESDALGAADEQHSEPGRGDSAARSHLELAPYDLFTERKRPYFDHESEKQELLRNSDALKDHRAEIAAYFAEHRDSTERGNFVAGFFDSTLTGTILSNGQMAAYRAYREGISLYRGGYMNPNEEASLRWETVAERIYGMIVTGQWLDTDEHSPSQEDEQESPAVVETDEREVETVAEGDVQGDEQPPTDEQPEEVVRGHLDEALFDPFAPNGTPYYHYDLEKQELLRNSDALKDHRLTIAAYFADHEDRKERGDFVAGFFNNTLTESILSNDQRAGYRAFRGVLRLYRGGYMNPEMETFMRWESVADTIYGMMLMEQWLDPDERPLPTEAEQISLIDEAQVDKEIAFALPQEAIDYVLMGGGIVSGGKFRIYEQFQKGETAKENINFLKNEYGTGGHSDAIPGTGIWEDHDSNGIKFWRAVDESDPAFFRFTLQWPKIEKRIRELITADRYLSAADKEAYPNFLRGREIREQRGKIADEFRSIVDDYNDFMDSLGYDDRKLNQYILSDCSREFRFGSKTTSALDRGGNFVLPVMREAMQTIMSAETHLTERCEAMLAELSGPLAMGLEPTEEELNPPPEPKKEYRISLGDTVYIGSQEYDVLSLGEETVTLSDPDYPLFTKEFSREEFDRKIAENPMNDRYLHEVEEQAKAETYVPFDEAGRFTIHEMSYPEQDDQYAIYDEEKNDYFVDDDGLIHSYETPEEAVDYYFSVVVPKVEQEKNAPAPETPEKQYDLGYGYMGNGLTVWNRLEEEHGDYKTVAHIEADRTVTFYDEAMPESVKAQIREVAETTEMTISATQDASVFSTPSRVKEQPQPEQSGNEMWQKYSRFKAEFDGSIVMYQVGDFYEVLGDDAHIVAEALDIGLTTRNVGLKERVPMCGVPTKAGDTPITMLNDRGYDVLVVDDKGQTYPLKSYHKDAPVASKPVGRIDYLRSNGEVGYSTEYTDADQFVRDMLDDNQYGVPMSVVVYRDKDGSTIPTDFVERFDPPPQGYEILDYEKERPESSLDRAKKLIDDYCEREFGGESEYDDLTKVPIGHTTLEDEEIPMQVYADLINCRIDRYLDLKLVERREYDSLEDLIANELNALDFAELISFTDEQLEAAKRDFAETTNDRFYVVDVERGSKRAYAVWDDSTGGYYVDEEGVTEEFDSRWQAESYCKQLNESRPAQEVSDLSDPFAYRLLGRLKADCDYFLGNGQRAEKHLWAGSVETQIAKMRELYAQVENKPTWLTEQDIDRYEREMTAEPEQTAQFRVGDVIQIGNDDDVPEYRVLSTVKTAYNEIGRPVTMYGFNAYWDKELQRLKFSNTAQLPENEPIKVVWHFELIDGRSVEDSMLLGHVRDALRSAGYEVSDETLDAGLSEYRAHNGHGNFEDIADFIEDEFLSEEEPPDLSDIEEEPQPPQDRTDEMLQQAMLAAQLAEQTGQMVFGFEEGNPLPINAPKLKQDAEPKQTEKDKPPAHPQPAAKPRGKVAPEILYPQIPSSQRHDYRITDDRIGVGTPGERYAHNVAAIRLLKRLEAEERLATPDEQEVLAQYVGWGGLADCFDERHSKYQELKALLDEDEYTAARESTLTAFYTPPVVIRAMYQALENMGFKSGNVLEPSCGVGNFLGMKPESLADTRIYGVELDSISGRIACQLYQKSSIAVQSFEKTELPDSFFDVAIGNIPFGNFKLSDKRYDKHNFLIHDYFFAKTLDRVRPGGIVAFVTSKGTMDKESPAVRKYIAQRADLLGAIRLPNNTFKDAAGTDVTSDILFFQKRDTLTAEEPDWVHLNTDENGLTMNQYFIDNPDMVMGEMREISGPFGPETACIAYDGQDLEDELSEAIQSITGSITEYEFEELQDEEEDNSIPADPSVRNFSYTLVDGKVYYRQNSRMVPVDLSVTAANRVKGLISIRDCVRNLIEYQTEDYPDDPILTEQAKLNRLYDEFVKKYGNINSRANKSAFNTDNSYFLLSSLEVLDDEGHFVRKADIFSKRTIKPYKPILHVDTASEALAVSLAEKAKIDMDYMMELTGKTEDEIFTDLKGVIFLNPLYDGVSQSIAKYLPADEYLSGNVREKLREAKRSAEIDPENFTVNVEALEKVQPVDLTAAEISVRIGATWIPPETYAQFMYELFDTPAYARWNIKVHYSQYTGEWNIEGKSYDRSNVKSENTYGTLRINGYKIMEQTLNLKDVRIFDYVEDEEGKKKPVLNTTETAIAQAKQELIKQAFQNWIWRDQGRREMLCQLYNERFNSVRPREYDGSHLTLAGINPEITLRQHQLNAVARGLYGGNELLGHVVGAGKTYTMVSIAQESKRLGLCHKSLIVVPNHLTEQWAAEYLQLYPAANILVATAKDFEAKNRKRFCGRIATGEYDAIIIGHTQLEKIPLSFGRQVYYLEQQRNEILAGISELKANKGDRFSVKQLERTKKTIEAKLEKLNDQDRKDDLVTFEELGVDKLFIDEAHYYKNLAAFSKMRNVGGISQTEAQKSSDLYMKCRYMDELTGGRGVCFATGTPNF